MGDMDNLYLPSNFPLLNYRVLLDGINENVARERLTEKKRSFDEAFLNALERGENYPTSEDQDKKLLDASHELEALFIGNMLKSMRNTINEVDFFGKSIAKDIFSDMLYDEYAKLMAKTDQFGLGLQIYNQVRLQKSI